MPGEENVNENLQGADNTNEQNLSGGEQNPVGDEQEPQGNEQNPPGSEQNQNKDNTKSTKGDEIDTEIYGSPEKFDYSEIQLPEGMQLDEELLKEFEPLAKKMNLSNKSANELMGLAVKLAEKNFTKLSGFAEEIQQTKKNSYLELLNTDEELNAGDKTKYDAYINTAIQGVQAFATQGFKDLIKAEGLTHHPEFIKTFHKIGELCISEKIPDATFPVGQGKIDDADVLYGGKKD